MRNRAIFWALTLLGVAVILQTTVFTRLEQFQIYPDVVLLIVILAARYLDPDPALLLGFTGGFAVDLLSTTPMGLRALVMTLVAYAAIRTLDIVEANPLTSLAGVALLSLLGVVLLALLGTLFNQGSLTGGTVIRSILLIPTYNTLLSLAALPLVRRLLHPRTRVLV